MSSSLGCKVEKLVSIMERLRSPGGCPWDREQTHRSLRPYLIEEAYEAVEAIDSGDPAAGAETAIAWWTSRGEDPATKLVIFSDGLDVAKIAELSQRFHGRVKVS